VYAVTNFLTLGRASFTDYSKATRVRKFYTAYTGVVETKSSLPSLPEFYKTFPGLKISYTHHIQSGSSITAMLRGTQYQEPN